jgi:hypothetical protein
METASNLAPTLRTFSTNAEATGYLEHEGFTFMGAPGRWLHVEEEGLYMPGSCQPRGPSKSACVGRKSNHRRD